VAALASRLYRENLSGDYAYLLGFILLFLNGEFLRLGKLLEIQ